MHFFVLHYSNGSFKNKQSNLSKHQKWLTLWCSSFKWLFFILVYHNTNLKHNTSEVRIWTHYICLLLSIWTHPHQSHSNILSHDVDANWIRAVHLFFLLHHHDHYHYEDHHYDYHHYDYHHYVNVYYQRSWKIAVGLPLPGMQAPAPPGIGTVPCTLSRPCCLSRIPH